MNDVSTTPPEDGPLPLGDPPIVVSAFPAPAPRWAVIGIFLLMLLGALAYARAFLVPVVFAFLLTLVFSPMRRFLDRRGLGSGLSALLIVGALLIALVGGLFMLSGPVTDWVDQAPTIGRQLQEKLQELRLAAEGMREAAEQVDQMASGGETPGAQQVVVDDSGIAVSAAVALPAILAQMVFMLILLFFLLASGDMIYEKIVHALPTFNDKRRAMRIARDIERKLSRYLFTITVINAGLGVSIGLGLWILDMPNPVLFGVIAFVLNFIPYLGAILGVLITVVVGLVSLPQTNEALLVGVFYFAMTSIEGQFVTPFFVGRSLRLNTVVVFLSVTLWAWLWSVVGMVVATPLLVAIRTFCEHIPRLEPVGDFLSARGAESEKDPDEDDAPDARANPKGAETTPDHKRGDAA